MRTRLVLAVAVVLILASCGGSSQSASETTVTINSTVAINSNEQKLIQLKAAYAAAKSATSDAWSLVTKFYNEIPQESPPSTSPPSTSPPSTSPPSTSPPSTSPPSTASFASQIFLIVGRYPVETSCGISREILSESKIANWTGDHGRGIWFVNDFLHNLSIPSSCFRTGSTPFIIWPYFYIGGSDASIYPNQILGYQDILDTYIPPLIEGEKEFRKLYEIAGVYGDAAAGNEVQRKWTKLLFEFQIKFSERHESNRQKLAVELKSASALQSAREPSPEVTTAPSPEVTTAPSPVVTLPVATYASKVFAYCSGVVECKTAYSKWEQLKTIENLAFSSIVKFIRSIAPPKTSPPVTSAPRLSKPSGSCALESGTPVSNGKSFTNSDGSVYKCQNGNWIMTSQPSGGGTKQQPQSQKIVVDYGCQSRLISTSSFSGNYYSWQEWVIYDDGSRRYYPGAGSNPPC